MEDLIENIDKLIEGTKKGKITWEPHSTSFIWKTHNDEGKNMNVVLQPKGATDKKTNIMFRLWDVDSQLSLIEVNTSSASDDVKTKILMLYSIAKSSSSIGRIDILSDLLKGI